MVFRNIFAGFSKAALLLGFVVIGLLSAVPAKAQESDLKAGLNDLSTAYQSEVQRLEKRQQQSKELFDDGLISRVEFENGEKSLADARAKVEQIANEIAAANKPAPVITPNLVSELSDPPWSTGNSKIDSLIRHYGTQHGVDPYLIYCLMSQESGFSAGATSNKGAQGLMQLMPGTAARYGVTNP